MSTNVVLLNSLFTRSEYYKIANSPDIISSIRSDVFAKTHASLETSLPPLNHDTAYAVAVLAEYHLMYYRTALRKTFSQAELEASALLTVLYGMYASHTLRTQLIIGDVISAELALYIINSLLKGHHKGKDMEIVRNIYFHLDVLEYIPENEIVIPEAD